MLAAWEVRNALSSLIEAVMVAVFGSYDEAHYQQRRVEHGLSPPLKPGLNGTTALEGNYRMMAGTFGASNRQVLDRLRESITQDSFVLEVPICAHLRPIGDKARVHVYEAGELALPQTCIEAAGVDLASPLPGTIAFRVTFDHDFIAYPSLDPATLQKIQGIKLLWKIRAGNKTTYGAFGSCAKVSLSWVAFYQLAKQAHDQLYHIPQLPPPVVPTRKTSGVSRIDRALENALNGRLIVKCVGISGGKVHMPIPKAPSKLSGKGAAIHDNVKLPGYLYKLRYDDHEDLLTIIRCTPSEPNAIQMGVMKAGDEVTMVTPWQDIAYPKPIESLITMCAQFADVSRPARVLPKTTNIHREVIIREAQALSRSALVRSMKRTNNGTTFELWKHRVIIPLGAVSVLTRMNKGQPTEVRWGISQDERLFVSGSGAKHTFSKTDQEAKAIVARCREIIALIAQEGSQEAAAAALRPHI